MTDHNLEQLDELMDELVYGLLKESTARRVREKITMDPVWQLAYEAAVARKKTLAASVGPQADARTRGTQTTGGADGTQAAAKSPRLASGKSVIAAAKQRQRKATIRRRLFTWPLSGVAAAAAIVIGVMWIRAATISPPKTVVRLLGQAELSSGSAAAVRALVTTLAGEPKEGVPVTFLLKGLADQGEEVLGRFVSDRFGSAAGEVHLPPVQGSAVLVARTDEEFSQVEATIRIQRACKVYLSTDKPIYQPGQTIHMRCLVLRKPAMNPDAGGAVEFTLNDPAGNMVYKSAPALSEYGIAWADVPLDTLVTPGRYTVKAVAASDVSEQTVEVFFYKLPAFSVKLTLDKPYYLPGQTVSGKVEVRYHFGKPVNAGKVELELSDRAVASQHTLNKKTLTTDEDGKAGFEFHLPANMTGLSKNHGGAELLLTARATDSASQENVGFRNVPVSGQDIRLAVVAENGAAARGKPGRLYVVASYPDGRPAQAVLDIESIAQSIKTDEAGAAIVEMQAVPERLTIRARDARGKTGESTLAVPAAEGEMLILRSDKPLYTAGQTMSLEVLAAQQGLIFVDVVKDRQTVLTKALDVSAQEGRAGILRGRLAMDLPADVSGTLTLHAYRMSDAGEWAGRDLLIVVKPAGELKVDVKGDRAEYRPGADANILFRVTGADGKPVAAALSLAAVDEAVYSVQQAAPGLEGLLAGLDEQILAPAIEAHGFSPGLMEQDEIYARAVLSAAVPPPTGPRKTGAAERLVREGRISQASVDRMKAMGRTRVIEALKNHPELREVATADLLQDLFGSDTDRTLDLDNRASAERAYATRKYHAESATEKAVVRGGLVGGAALALLVLMAMFRSDGLQPSWARRHGVLAVLVFLLPILAASLVMGSIVLSPGAKAGRAEGAQAAEEMAFLVKDKAAFDRPVSRMIGVGDSASPLSVATASPAARPIAVTEVPVTTGAIAAPKSAEPAAEPARTRTFFPETMLWRPQVITDPQGVAELSIPLADSITSWRLAGSAVSKEGRLGRVEAAIKVFQPFFVDINAPLTLTQNDEVSVPVVVYNYAATALDVALKARGEKGLELVDASDAAIRVQPGEVKRHFVRVKAGKIGEAALTVDASAGTSADSVRREIRVEPPGLPAALAVSGALIDGPQFVDLAIPPDAVPGSLALTLKVYPSTFSELLEGLDNIFRMPNGCFEQTSSTTYPNVMALSYMKAHKIDKPEIAAKATHYIQLGYQRLLTFESKGGGFDWFGGPKANVVLTAYGVMEFSDMSKVHAVDPALLNRTCGWLAGRQGGDGSWSFESGCFHEPFTGGDNSALAVTAYVTWALATHDPELASARKGCEYITSHAAEASSPRTLALCACALLTSDPRSEEGIALLRKLADLVREDEKGGTYWSDSQSAGGATARPARGRAFSHGGSDDVATTATAVLALAKRPEFGNLRTSALKWLAARKDPSGTWGTTQATVLALKALLAGSGAPIKRTETATLNVFAEGRTEAGAAMGKLVIAPEQSDVVQAVRLAVPEGARSLRLQIDGQKAAGMGYQLALRYHTRTQAAPAGSPLAMEVHYDRTSLSVNQTVSVEAIVRNRTADTARMLLADIGTPPGFVVEASGLEKMRSAGQIDRYTLTARGVIVYINSIGPSKDLHITYTMTARMPLKAVAAPTKVYAYYAPEKTAAVPALTFTVK